MWLELIKILNSFNDHYDKVEKDIQGLKQDFIKLKLVLFAFAAGLTIFGTLKVDGQAVHSSVCVILMFIAAYAIPMVAKAILLEMNGIPFRTKEFEERAEREALKRKEKEKENDFRK